MNPEDLEKLWSDPKHYKKGMIYYCKEDPRVIVPKRPKWAGWTLNFAHTHAWWILASTIFWFFAPVTFEIFIWPRTDLGLIISILLSGVGIGLYSVWTYARLKSKGAL